MLWHPLIGCDYKDSNIVCPLSSRSCRLARGDVDTETVTESMSGKRPAGKVGRGRRARRPGSQKRLSRVHLYVLFPLTTRCWVLRIDWHVLFPDSLRALQNKEQQQEGAYEGPTRGLFIGRN